MERICFQVEEAQWFYEDFIRPLDPALPSLSLKAFALRIFQHCPLLSQWSHYHHNTAFSEFLAYKTRVPVRGAILLNESMDQVVLVKGWKKGANWSFPRGKINKDEKDLDCAIREVYEETGFEVQEAGFVKPERDMKYIEISMREQHMRLYVFRGIPLDTKFEPRTRKEISKIEWYKLSDLPTIRKNKQHEEHPVANANKFYMVAPFLNPLKKWIAQQRKNDTNKTSNTTQPTHLVTQAGEIAVDGGGPGVAGNLPQKQVPAQAQTPSDLPEVSETQDASSHLKRLLNINGPMPSPQNTHANENKPADPDPSKSNALLSLLRGGSNNVASNIPAQETTQIPQVPQPPHMARPPERHPVQTAPVNAPFGGLPQHSQLPMQQSGAPGMNTAMHFQQGQPPIHPLHTGHAPNHTPRPDFGMFNQQQRLPHGPPVSHFPQQPVPATGLPSNQRMPSLAPSQQPHHIPPQQEPISIAQQSAPSSRRQTPAPYQRTGDPEFTHASGADNVQPQSIPPANKLPPPKLTSHSLALLSVFRDETNPQHTGSTLVNPPKQGAESSSGGRKVQNQDILLDLLKRQPGPATAGVQGTQQQPARAELAAQQTPSVKQVTVNQQNRSRDYEGTSTSQVYQPRPREAPKTRLGKDTTTSATVSGPLNVPQFEQISKSSKQSSNTASQKPGKDQKPKIPSVVILPRPNTEKKNSPPSTQQVGPAPTQPQMQKTKQPEPAKPFQPQILRRQPKPDLEDSLPTRTVTVSEFSQPGREKPVAEPQKEPARLIYDRHPSQTATQKEALLSLFGKPGSPPVQTGTATSNQFSPPTKSPAQSTVISPVEKTTFGTDVQAEVGQAPVSRLGSISSAADTGSQTSNKTKVTSPTNKAFLLGFLDGVAKGNR